MTESTRTVELSISREKLDEIQRFAKMTTGWTEVGAKYADWEMTGRRLAEDALTLVATVERLMEAVRVHHEFGPGPDAESACPCCGGEVDEYDLGLVAK